MPLYSMGAIGIAVGLICSAVTIDDWDRILAWQFIAILAACFVVVAYGAGAFSLLIP